MDNNRTEYDVGLIFREQGQDYERNHQMSKIQRKALRALAVCRTAYLGGHLEKCSECGFERPVYNSCRNGNCPKCQNSKRTDWIAKRLDELLPVPYFHIIFTIPDSFNELYRNDYKFLCGTLFKAASKTMLKFFKQRDLVPMITATLHTWGQTISIHPHIHMLVTGGGLTSQQQWETIGNNYLFDVKQLSVEFSKLFIKLLTKKYPLPANTVQDKWVVHIKKPFAGASTVVKYLGRYVYRSAIANSRIVNYADHKVTFSYKDNRDCDPNGNPKEKTMRLDGEEFIRRFMQHIPAAGFRRIRFYGILAGSNRAAKIQTAMEQFTVETTTENRSSATETAFELFQDYGCPQCKNGIMQVVETLRAHSPPPIIFRNEKNWRSYAA